ncbi:MAG: glycosyltransferase [Saprospiraceae bacterium]|nr:glycosyltransferase [Saprospiraceae bacterium]
MKSELVLSHVGDYSMPPIIKRVSVDEKKTEFQSENLPEILFLTSYPPRECGIATYSQDLLRALNNKFSNSFKLKVCALESGAKNYTYPEEVFYTLDTENSYNYLELALNINETEKIKLVLIQHEFGFFTNKKEFDFLQFLYNLSKPVIIVFHTVLPKPNPELCLNVQRICAACESVIVMTKNSSVVLIEDYGVVDSKINVIAHGTHLVPHLSKESLKEKYDLKGRKVLSTFGLLSSGKGIETTLCALPEIIEEIPEAIFLIIGKTHPGVVQREGEIYRNNLQMKVAELKLADHVKFINNYLPLEDLLEYLQLTDIYLFTSNDPNQAVSGTFSYAMSCACPIVSTPIPHAKEVLRDDTGIIIDFQDAKQLAEGVNLLMKDEPKRKAFSSNTLQRIVPTSWENSAITHAILLQKVAGAIQMNSKVDPGVTKVEDSKNQFKYIIELQYRLPEVSLDFVKKLTTEFGMIQFSKINKPDIESGYTLDDNARALVAVCMHYELTGDLKDLNLLRIYFNFIKFCFQKDGNFLNYVDKYQNFTTQNQETNLADSMGRAIWSLGYLISKKKLIPVELIIEAQVILDSVLVHLENLHSTRAMAFSIKGLYYSNLELRSSRVSKLIKLLADRLVQMYKHEAEHHWQWFESYMTYANSVLPEAMLCAWLETAEPVYKEIAKSSFDFLLSLTFNGKKIKVISNSSWLHKGIEPALHGEQPIDVAYTILALDKFYSEYKDPKYLDKLKIAFNWFLGNNHLHQIIYNPCTGGCFDGLEENHVNLNQGAESTVSYLMARLTIEKYSKDLYE